VRFIFLVRPIVRWPAAQAADGHAQANVRFVVFLSIKAFEAAWNAACGAKGPSAVMVVPAQRSFLVGPVSFQGPCASGRVTVQVRGRQVRMSCMSVVSPFLLHRDKQTDCVLCFFFLMFWKRSSSSVGLLARL